LGAATDDQVIVAWLQAEIDSPRFEDLYFGPWESPGDVAFVKQVVKTPNLGDPAENYIRRTKLAVVRGFGWDHALFKGLARDVTWRRVRFTTDEIADMLYARHVDWATLAPETRRVSEGAAKVAAFRPADKFAYILILAQQIRDNDPPPSFPEIICLRRPDGAISVMEGHGRATAYVKEAGKLPGGIEAYLGSGASVARWLYL
jgi:hypothetical protein